MLKVAALQMRLIRKLCALPTASEVTLPWLQNEVWPGLPDDWINRFWTMDKKARQAPMNAIAALPLASKDRIKQILRQQRYFARGPRPTDPLAQKIDWDKNRQPAMANLRNLLSDFYAPWLYDENGGERGYPLPTGRFHKDIFIAGFRRENILLKVCPYCDVNLKNRSLDHYFPQNSFPFLVCHPDNLIPCCGDCNKDKGSPAPCDWRPQTGNQTADRWGWFHPRLRPARHCLRLRFVVTPAREFRVYLTAKKSKNRLRMARFDRQFKVAEFWNEQLIGEYRSLENETVNELITNRSPTSAAASRLLRKRAMGIRPEIDGLAILKRGLLQYIVKSDILLKDFATSCSEALYSRKIAA